MWHSLSFHEAKSKIEDLLRHDHRVNGVGTSGNIATGLKIVVLLTEDIEPTMVPKEVHGWPVVTDYVGEVHQGG